LEDANRLNPSDDLTSRVLAMAQDASGNHEAAGAALRYAVETQRSDPTNLLLMARWQMATGRDAEARETLAAVIQSWPEIVAAPGWSDFIPSSISTPELVDDGLDRWSRALPSPEPRSLQPALLAIWAGRSGLAEDYADVTLGPSPGSIYVGAMSCSPNASQLLEKASDSFKRSSLYWALVVRRSALDGQVDDRALRLFAIMSGNPLLSGSTDETLNPLHENGVGGFSADIWGYRRLPIYWPEYQGLPLPRAGAARWILRSREAVESTGLGDALEACL
jgi:hypothetical protein